MVEPRTIPTAIAAHKAAWQAFQDAPDGKPALLAEDLESSAMVALLATVPANLQELDALVAHLCWYCEEEAQREGNGDLDNLPFAYAKTLLRAMSIAVERARQPAPDFAAKASALVDAVAFDEHGVIVAGEFRGGNGGLLSNETIAAAHALRRELLGLDRQPAAGEKSTLRGERGDG